MKRRLLVLGFLLSTLLIFGCIQTPKCTTTKDCPKDKICVNGACNLPPECRKLNETCAVTNDCCEGLICEAYKCVQLTCPDGTKVTDFSQCQKGISERDSAAYWAGADVGITRYFLSATAGTTNTQLVVRNNRLFQINLTSITFDGGSNLLNMTTQSGGILMTPGSTAYVLLNTTGAAPCTNGQVFSKNVVITYKDATYGVSYIYTGEKPLVGTCQD